MEAFVTALIAAVTPTALWGALEEMVPFLAVAVLFALGYRFVRRGVGGISKGKAKI